MSVITSEGFTLYYSELKRKQKKEQKKKKTNKNKIKRVGEGADV